MLLAIVVGEEVSVDVDLTLVFVPEPVVEGTSDVVITSAFEDKVGKVAVELPVEDVVFPMLVEVFAMSVEGLVELVSVISALTTVAFRVSGNTKEGQGEKDQEDQMIRKV